MKVALIGAGGKMGCRLAANLLKTAYELACVEVSEQGTVRLAEIGLAPVSLDSALDGAGAVILAVPDTVIGRVAGDIVPRLQPDTLLLVLDPAAAFLGQLPERGDVAYMAAHPCHPPLFSDETSPEARRDFFGGVAAKQSVVCALIQGDEAHYRTGKQLVEAIYAPVARIHRITLEQMAMMEPTMAETIGATVAVLAREAMDEAVRRGVPEAAARDFMLGHMNILLAVAFGEAKNPLSDACQIAVEYGKQHLIRDNWRSLFEPESVREQIQMMLNLDEWALHKAKDKEVRP
ncbi:phosphogluconate dehydrogenase C-terminal domain-containing protein [Paenibacillus piri]|nr:phosphogluconate dehydrogenase C-terminal domain-containing protein [Paenibacillus piri]